MFLYLTFVENKMTKDIFLNVLAVMGDIKNIVNYSPYVDIMDIYCYISINDLTEETR